MLSGNAYNKARLAGLCFSVGAARGPYGVRTECTGVQLLRIAVRMRRYIFERTAALARDSRSAIIEYVLVPMLPSAGIRQVDFFNACQFVRADAVRWNSATIRGIYRRLRHLTHLS